MRHGFLTVLVTLSISMVSAAASADVVQGSVQPSGARVNIKDSQGNVVIELGSGPFQLQLPTGQFVAECVTPTQRSIPLFSISVPTSVVIDCS